MSSSALTAATLAKAAAIRAGLAVLGTDPAPLLAMLTSALKEERETAKGLVRGLVAAAERQRIKTEHAASLAAFSNRHEP